MAILTGISIIVDVGVAVVVTVVVNNAII